MSMKYQWKRYGHPVNLSELDELVCAHMGVEPLPEDYHPVFLFGFNLWLDESKGRTLEGMADGTVPNAYMKVEDEEGAARMARLQATAKWLIDNGYAFDSWREVY
jgi:hypothetical protein